MIAVVFYSGLQIHKRYEIQKKTSREISFALFLMEKELENMVFFDLSRCCPQKHSFVGRADSISFMSGSDKGLAVIRYFLLPQEKTSFYSLVRQEIAFSDYINDSFDENSHCQVLSSHVTENGLRFFYGVIKPSVLNEYHFENEWNCPDVPAFIRIEIDSGVNKYINTIRKDVFISSGYIGEQE
jgi:hypothetical protein